MDTGIIISAANQLSYEALQNGDSHGALFYNNVAHLLDRCLKIQSAKAKQNFAPPTTTVASDKEKEVAQAH